MEITAAWSIWFLPTSGHSLMEEADIPRLIGLEYHVSSYRQEQERMTV